MCLQFSLEMKEPYRGPVSYNDMQFIQMQPKQKTVPKTWLRHSELSRYQNELLEKSEIQIEAS